MNPFGVGAIHESPVRSPSGHGPVLTRDAGRATRLRPEAPPGGDDAPAYETRRSDLYPEVRTFADKLHAKILGIYKKYGATNIREMLENAEAGKGPKLKRQDVEEISKSLDALNFTLLNNELPPSQRELPPLEVFQETITRIGEDLNFLNAYVCGLDRWDEYELIDGKLNGRVKVFARGISVPERWWPIVNGELVERVDGYLVNDCRDVRNIGGKLNGSILAQDDEDVAWYPVIDGRIIKRVGDREFKNFKEVRNVRGKLNGVMECQNLLSLPIIEGQVVERIDGRKIVGCKDVRNIGGRLNGVVIFEDDPLLLVTLILPVIDGHVIETAGSHKILRCYDVRNVGGKLNCTVEITNKEGEKVWLPVLDGQLIEEIEGKRIDHFSQLRNVDGELNGSVRIGKRVLPVIAGKVIENIDGKSIDHCSVVRNIDGKLYGIVTIPLGYGQTRCLPVMAGEFIDEIDGMKIIDVTQESFSDAGGAFSGMVTFKNRQRKELKRRVFFGKIVG